MKDRIGKNVKLVFDALEKGLHKGVIWPEPQASRLRLAAAFGVELRTGARLH